MKIWLQLIWIMLQREYWSIYRSQTDYAWPFFFFILVSCLFPLALTPDPQLLKTLGPGVLWIAVILAFILALPRLLHDDERVGILDELLLMPYPLVGVIFIKLFIFWLFWLIPVLILLPLLALLFGLNLSSIVILMQGLLLASPTLVMVGGIAAALTLGLARANLLLMLILLPLFAPILIFAAARGDVHISLQNLSAANYWLAGFLCFSVSLIPGVIAKILRA